MHGKYLQHRHQFPENMFLVIMAFISLNQFVQLTAVGYKWLSSYCASETWQIIVFIISFEYPSHYITAVIKQAISLFHHDEMESPSSN
jgi:hypothetical protein